MAAACGGRIAWSRMMIRAERGERTAPLAYLSEVQGALDRGGYLPGAIWTRALTCRLLFLLGRRREALAQLSWMREVCARRETSAYDRIIARAAAEDPLALSRVTAQTAPAADVPARVRAIVRLVFVDRIGDDQLLAGVVIPEGPDHGFDRALVELARAGIAHHRGQLRLETQCLARAVSQAAAAGADVDLVPLLFEAWLGLAPRSGAHEVAGDGCAVIDGIRHEIRIGARRIPLRARPVSRQLLYAFAAAPSQYLARNTIALVLWGIDYDPLRHESTLKSNIRRLRMLLAGFAELPSETGGYSIVLPDRVEFIPPVVTGQPRPATDS
jgi:hypothetical protein